MQRERESMLYIQRVRGRRTPCSSALSLSFSLSLSLSLLLYDTVSLLCVALYVSLSCFGLSVAIPLFYADFMLLFYSLLYVAITLQHTATHCNIMQYTASHCITLQHTLCRYHIVVFTLYRVAKTHRVPYLHTSFSAKETYI